jgi:hypothetical protein
MISTVEESMETLSDAFTEMAKFVTVYAAGANMTWPYVHISAWDDLSVHVNSLTHTSSLIFLNRVKDPMAWTAYIQSVTPIPISPVVYQIIDRQIIPALTPGDYAVVSDLFLNMTNSLSYESFFMNLDAFSDEFFYKVAMQADKTRIGIVSDFVKAVEIDPKYFGNTGSRHLEKTKDLGDQVKSDKSNAIFSEEDVQSTYIHPVFESLGADAPVAGYLQGYISWKALFQTVLLKDEGVYIVVENTCNQTRTWLASTSGVQYLGNVSINTLLFDGIERATNASQYSECR